MEVAYEYLETRKSQSQCGSPEPGGGVTNSHFSLRVPMPRQCSRLEGWAKQEIGWGSAETRLGLRGFREAPSWIVVTTAGWVGPSWLPVGPENTAQGLHDGSLGLPAFTGPYGILTQQQQRKQNQWKSHSLCPQSLAQSFRNLWTSQKIFRQSSG